MTIRESLACLSVGTIAVISCGKPNDPRTDQARILSAASSTLLLGGRITVLDSLLQAHGVRLKPGRSATFVTIVSANDCLECGNYAAQNKMLQREVPQADHIFVGVGSDTLAFKEYVRAARANAFIDRDSIILHRLHVTHTPLFFLVDSQHRIAFVDSRHISSTSNNADAVLLLKSLFDVTPTSAPARAPFPRQ